MAPLKDPSWIKKQQRDIPYASLSPTQRLDLYFPNDTRPPYPLIVAIHGGGFIFGDKADDQLNAPVETVGQGYAVAAMNYRMADEAPFPAAVQDVKAAIRFLRANACEYDLDPQRIAAWGNSAGAYLAVMAGVTGNTTEFDAPSLGNTEISSNVQAVIDWFGPIDFLSLDDQLRASGKGKPEHGEAWSPESRFVGVPLAEADPDLLRRTNPLNYLAPGLPPFLIQHGDNDDLVPVEQSFLLADRLRAYLPPENIRVDILQGSLHGGPAFDLPENLAKVFSFLAATLARRN